MTRISVRISFQTPWPPDHGVSSIPVGLLLKSLLTFKQFFLYLSLELRNEQSVDAIKWTASIIKGKITFQSKKNHL